MRRPTLYMFIHLDFVAWEAGRLSKLLGCICTILASVATIAIEVFRCFCAFPVFEWWQLFVVACMLKHRRGITATCCCSRTPCCPATSCLFLFDDGASLVVRLVKFYLVGMDMVWYTDYHNEIKFFDITVLVLCYLLWYLVCI